MTTNIEGDFLEEVLNLFALEALEWVRQLKTALLELEGMPPPEQAQALHETLLRGLTNLKGSAATVNLPSVEELAFVLVPLLHAMQSEPVGSVSAHFAALRQGLEALASVIQVLAMAECKTAVMADLESVTRQHCHAVRCAVARAKAAPQAQVEEENSEHRSDWIPPVNAIQALLRLRQAPGWSSKPTRNLAAKVVRQIHRARDLDSPTAMAVSITLMLQDLETLDERFLAEVKHRTAAIAAVLASLKSTEEGTSERDKALHSALHEIAMLYECARRLEVIPIIQFLQGLETFLIELRAKHLTLTPEKYEAVAQRVGLILPMAQQWLELGRAERAAIEKVTGRLTSSDPALLEPADPSIPLTR